VYLEVKGSLYASADQCKSVTNITKSIQGSGKVSSFFVQGNRLLVAIHYGNSRKNILYYSKNGGRDFFQVSNDFELKGSEIEQIAAVRGNIFLRSCRQIYVNLGPLGVYRPSGGP
jgi:hypothetical protein